MTINSLTPGETPHESDSTRSWVNAYRVNDKVKPAFIIRAATDSNYINNQITKLPAYSNSGQYMQAICNVISPGQRIPGVVSWQATESLESLTQTATLTVIDALPRSNITATVTGFAVGTGDNADTYLKGLNKGGAITTGTIATSSVATLPQRWLSNTIRYQWVTNGHGIATQLVGDYRAQDFLDSTLAANQYGSGNFHESNLLYRIFEPEIIKVDNLTAFPDPAVPYAESEGENEWWNIDNDGSLVGVGAYFILMRDEVMRVVRIDRSKGYIFIIPGGRGIAGTISEHFVGDKITLLGFPPYTPQWTALGYLTPSDFKVLQSCFRPGTCFASYEGYGNPGNYTSSKGKGPFSKKGLYDKTFSKTFDRQNNMCFTGYWFTQSTQITFDNTAAPQLQVSLSSSGHILDHQKIDINNVQRSKNMYTSGGWGKATFDEVGLDRKMPGDWYDFNMWDPDLPGSYPLTICTEYAQHKNFMDHMNSTNMGTQCSQCQGEWINFVTQHEHGTPTGSIAEARAVGKHIYFESIRVYNLGGRYNAGPLKTYGRLMHALAIGAWDNPQVGDNLGTRWTKVPDRLFTNLTTWNNGRVWNGQLAYRPASSTTDFDWSHFPNDPFVVYGRRRDLHCPFQSQYDNQPWSQPMTDLASLNRMTYTITREGFPVFAPIGMKLRGIPSSALSNLSGFHYSGTTDSIFTNKYGVQVTDNDIGMGEWHMRYGGSIDAYESTVDPSSTLSLVYVSCQTAFGDEVSFTLPAAGTGVRFNSGNAGTGLSTEPGNKSPEHVIMFSNITGNKDAMGLTSGTQQTDTASLDNLLLGLDWNTQPASWGLELKRGPDQLTKVDARPPCPKPNPGWDIEYNSNSAANHPDVVKKVQQFLNFMMSHRYIGGAVYVAGTGVTQTALQLIEDGKFVKDNGKATDKALRQAQSFFEDKSNHSKLGGAIFAKNGQGNYYYQESTNAQRKNSTDNPGEWGIATYSAANQWLKTNAEYIMTDIWWYVQNGLTWDQYVASIVGFPIPQDQVPNSNGMWALDQLAMAIEEQNWMKKFFFDAITYGNSLVDESINKSYTKTINTNFGDPRIQLGDVIWVEVPGYMGKTNLFGSAVVPFNNGVYVTSIERSIDLQNGTFTGSYTGYRYRGKLDNNVAKNISNYVTSNTEI